jgi:hypothetical protein
MSKSKAYYYDLETLLNCFTATFTPRDFSQPSIVFEISERRSEIGALRTFLREEFPTLIGYNNLNFDSQVLAFILEQYDLLVELDGFAQAVAIYTRAQEIISEERTTRVSSLDVYELDLYLLHHFDNDAKRTSLKWIECHLRMDNVQEMPFAYDKPIAKENIDAVIRYNRNDTIATRMLGTHNRTAELLEMRKWAVITYGQKKLWNYSNASLGEFMLMDKIISRTGEDPVPHRVHDFRLKNIILPQVKFKTREFQKVYDRMCPIRIAHHLPAPSLKIKQKYDGLEYQFGLGGLHGASENTRHADIHTIDAVSYYPNISIKFGLAPRHLGKNFIEPYSEMFEMRLKSKKGSVQNVAWKEALNSAFGKSNSEFSQLYDPMFTYSITINGQLLMAMLAEEITLSGAGKVIMANTDGLEVQCYNEARLKEVMLWWESLTKITLESSIYKRMLIRDVNNYMALKQDDTVKAKGAYEVNKEFHKDPSMRVVALLTGNYFLSHTDPGRAQIIEDLKKHAAMDPMDFFLYQRAKTGDLVGHTSAGVEVEFPRTMRYIIIKNGKEGFILSRRTSKTHSKVHKDGWIAPMNEMHDEETSLEDIVKNIDYGWYATEIQKLLLQHTSMSVPTLFT